MKTIRLKRDLKYRWEQYNPTLDAGEPGIELDTGKLKIGNGTAHWVDLPYFTPITLDQEVTDAEILAHIQALTPHPAYDEIPSLTLLFENGLV